MKSLRQIYRDLVARGMDAEADPTEGSGDFLAKVRVNITAANRLRREGRSQPVDIAYCRDLISRESKPVWEWLPRETGSRWKLQPHQWSRRLPVSEGDRKVRLQLACPAQTETGWAYLYSVAALCAHGADDAWNIGKCPVLMRTWTSMIRALIVFSAKHTNSRRGWSIRMSFLTASFLKHDR